MMKTLCSRALHWAAFSGRVNATEFLLQRGADRSLRDRTNHSAGDYARENGHKLVSILLDSEKVMSYRLVDALPRGSLKVDSWGCATFVNLLNATLHCPGDQCHNVRHQEAEPGLHSPLVCAPMGTLLRSCALLGWFAYCMAALGWPKRAHYVRPRSHAHLSAVCLRGCFATCGRSGTTGRCWPRAQPWALTSCC